MTLAEFLLTRIAEDEAVARAVQRRTAAIGTDEAWIVSGSDSYVGDYDPTRVLAECDAKRRIVRRWLETAPTVAAWGGNLGWTDSYTQSVNETLTDDVLPYLALPYAGHPDYRQEWIP